MKTALIIITPLLVIGTAVALVLSRGDSDKPPAGSETVSSPAKNTADERASEPTVTAGSAVISDVAAALSVECRNETALETYQSVHAVCERDGDLFRIDDVSASSAEQIGRFEAAVQFGCLSDLFSGGILDIPAVKTEKAILSSYLLSSEIDLQSLREAAVEAGYEAELVNMCESFRPDLGDLGEVAYAVRLGSLVMVLQSVGVEGCADQAFRFGHFGYETVHCAGADLTDPTDDIIAVSLENAEPVAFDVRANALNFAVCSEASAGKTILIGDDLHVGGIDAEGLTSVYSQLVKVDGYEEAILVDSCGLNQ